jgi:hypothetical protein
MVNFCDSSPTIGSCPPFANRDDVVNLLLAYCAECYAEIPAATLYADICNTAFGGAIDENCDYVIVKRGEQFLISVDCQNWHLLNENICYAEVNTGILPEEFVCETWGDVADLPDASACPLLMIIQGCELWIGINDPIACDLGECPSVPNTGTGWIHIKSIQDPMLFESSGLMLQAIDNDRIVVGTGSIVSSGVIINSDDKKVLSVSTAADWIGGASLETTTDWISVYVDANGNKLLHNALPNATVEESPKATGRINQAGWVGTAGLGLRATSFVYDTDVGEANIEVGDLVIFYTDAAYELGRKKISAGTGFKYWMNTVIVTAINTGTNTITLFGNEAPLFDNDYFIVVPYGRPLYRKFGNIWYTWIGAYYNDSAGDLIDRHDLREVSIAGTAIMTGTTATSIGLSTPMFTLGRGLDIKFSTNISLTVAATHAIALDVTINGGVTFQPRQMQYQTNSTVVRAPTTVTRHVTLTPGTYSPEIFATVTAGASFTIYSPVLSVADGERNERG